MGDGEALWQRSMGHLRSIIDDMKTARPPAASQETHELAARAVQAAHDREGEDQWAWATALAEDVADLSD